MIVCDKCGEKASYIMPLDYMGHKNINRIDLCEKDYTDLLEWINTKPENLELTDDPGKTEPIQAGEGISQSGFDSPCESEAKPRRGRPPKN